MRFFLDRHGCAKNQVDAELIHGIMLSSGWTSTDEPEDADLIIINSCGFIEDAKKESINAVVSARQAYPAAKILLAGCLAERYGNLLAESLPEADGFFGNGDLSMLTEILGRLFSKDLPPDSVNAGKRPVLIPPQVGVCSGDRPGLFSFPGSAYVKLTEGCSNWCSFCAIPLIRGPLRSRTIDEIVCECSSLVSRGVFELNFIGQDLAVFGLDGKPQDGQTCCPGDSVDGQNPSPLSLLLKRISSMPGDFRVRLLYMHPDHFPLDILPVMASDRRFLPYFDLPFQSGDENILRSMNRRGNAQKYLRLINTIRNSFSGSGNPYGTAVFRTTFLTGFPGETDRAFENTLSFLKEGRFLWVGAFAFSSEEGTAAHKIKPKISRKTASFRKKILYDAQEEITGEGLRFFVGKEVLVLVEECIPPETEEQEFLFAIGRAWFQAPEVDGSVVLRYRRSCSEETDGYKVSVAPGSIVRAKITAVRGSDVEAFRLED